MSSDSWICLPYIILSCPQNCPGAESWISTVTDINPELKSAFTETNIRVSHTLMLLDRNI